MTRYKKKSLNAIIIVFGNALLAISTALFVLPFSIDSGGLSGIAVILQKLFDPALLILILNWILFFIGLIFLKKEFALKTLISTIAYPVILNVLYHSPLYETFLHSIDDPLLATILGAILAGIGLGVVYKVGGSTGGVDVICVLMNKYLHIKISLATFAIDFVIVTLGLFFVSIPSALYGIIYIGIDAYLIEKITILGNSSYMMHIISSKSEEINDYIINELERGSTILDVKGGINGERKEMIEVIFNQKEYYKIKDNIYRIDKDAFVSVYSVSNVYGNGFEMLRK